MADEDRFAQIVSIGAHDLSTPLATVYGFAKTLAKTDLDEPAARCVAMIEAASAQLKELVDELSLVTRIERGRYSPMLTEVDALDLAREAGVRGGTAPCAYNAANEVAVEAFLDGRIAFLDVAEVVEETLARIDGSPARDLADLIAADEEARRLAAKGLQPA